jgi:hypothetical protein
VALPTEKAWGMNHFSESPDHVKQVFLSKKKKKGGLDPVFLPEFFEFI